MNKLDTIENKINKVEDRVSKIEETLKNNENDSVDLDKAALVVSLHKLTICKFSQSCTANN